MPKEWILQESASETDTEPETNTRAKLRQTQEEASVSYLARHSSTESESFVMKYEIESEDLKEMYTSYNEFAAEAPSAVSTHRRNLDEPALCESERFKNQYLSQLLHSWNVPILLNHFIKEGIYAEQLRRVQPHQIPKLVANFPLGVYIDFEYMLTRWQREQGAELVSHLTPITSVSSSPSYSLTAIPLAFSPANSACATSLSSPPAHTVGATVLPTSSGLPFPASSRSHEKTTNLDIILSRTTQGRMLIEYAKQQKELNNSNRKTLIDLIVNHYIDDNIKMSPATIQAIAKEIANLFPKECEEYYYLKCGKANPQGRLFNRYSNARVKLRQGGLVRAKVSQAEKVEYTIQKDIPDTIDSAEHKKIVKLENRSPSAFLLHWKGCAKERLDFIKKNTSTAAIIQEWPQYKKPWGYKLFDSDFCQLYSDHKKIFKMDDFYNKFLQIAANEVNDHECQKLIEALNTTADINANGKFSCLFYIMHGYFVPTKKSVRLDENGTKTIIKYSIKDSQNAFINCAPTIDDLNDRLELLQSFGEYIQPFVIIIGQIMEPREVFVYFDGMRYKLSSIISAIDLCFKIFHVFNLNYPLACCAVWQFIQLYFYNIKNQKDHSFPKIQILLKSLDKLNATDNE